ncbi:hypothetical protein [Bradyrhizobium retamae]|uniref:Uncharacterized protein n=1 Tax=Bradyrhizobium retamae TaxID=1300035 RepID=A0A0R3MXX9_9BRAD|nr:hypothetical protein [Bradyrhizobium retamae]KRR22182.1 hypothetical protein CQ13_30085 [Bradyrhizobium retamae]
MQALDQNFNAFISSLYDNGIVPPVMVLQDCDDDREHYKRTGCVAVLSADEDADCAVFGDWGNYYAFEGWLAFRSLSRAGDEFQLMVSDVVNNVEWSPETAEWISIISGLVNVQEEYADKFGHYPVDLNKFIKSYIRYGVNTVLRADVY